MRSLSFSTKREAIHGIAFAVNYPTPTARAGMADIVDTLRGMTDAGVNDYTIAGVPYWSDAQVQRVLDRHRNDFRFVAAQAVPEYPGSGSVWYRLRAAADSKPHGPGTLTRC